MTTEVLQAAGGFLGGIIIGVLVTRWATRATDIHRR
jgi:hypothetical protein